MTDTNDATDSDLAEEMGKEVALVALGFVLNKALDRHTEASLACIFNALNIGELAEISMGPLGDELEEAGVALSDAQVEVCEKALGLSIIGGYRCWFTLWLIRRGTLPESTRDDVITSRVRWQAIENMKNKIDLEPIELHMLAQYGTQIIARNLVGVVSGVDDTIMSHVNVPHPVFRTQGSVMRPPAR